MEKKFAKKIATYAMAATMIGGAVIGSGSTGVFAAEKYPSSATAKSAYSKVMSNTGTNYKKSYEDYKKAYEDVLDIRLLDGLKIRHETQYSQIIPMDRQ